MLNGFLKEKTFYIKQKHTSNFYKKNKIQHTRK